MPEEGSGALRRTLVDAPMTIVGQIVDSSNVTLLVRLEPPPGSSPPVRHGIYKPISGERPLWDFPEGNLAHREVAAAAVAKAGGWPLVPPTVLREGPFGPGSLQLWVTAVPGTEDAVAVTEPAEEGTDEDFLLLSEEGPPPQVRLVRRDAIPPGWFPVLRGEDDGGRLVVLAHADSPALRSIAVLDAVLNNSDRKASHLLVGAERRLWCIDHGLSLHAQDKLRTVLWGWAGRPLPDSELTRLHRLHAALTCEEGLRRALTTLLTDEEVEALLARTRRLLSSRRHPGPSPGWPAVPWPPL